MSVWREGEADAGGGVGVEGVVGGYGCCCCGGPGGYVDGAEASCEEDVVGGVGSGGGGGCVVGEGGCVCLYGLLLGWVDCVFGLRKCEG